jgi:hypothetical protein
MTSESQAAIEAQIETQRQAFEEFKKLLAASDHKVEIATDALFLYTQMTGLYSDFTAFLRAVQIGAVGSA